MFIAKSQQPDVNNVDRCAYICCFSALVLSVTHLYSLLVTSAWCLDILVIFSFAWHYSSTNEAGTGAGPQPPAPPPVLSQLPQTVAGKLNLNIWDTFISVKCKYDFKIDICI